MLTIYTDGACSGNGKINAMGGFSVVITENNQLIDTYSKGSSGTTNNREELKAILYSLIKYGKGLKETPVVYSDSAYSINTLTNWMYSWAKNGWVKSDKHTPENLDLIQSYYDLVVNQGYKIELRKIKGHSGHKWNELADRLAKSPEN